MIETIRLLIWLACETVALALLFFLILKAVSFLVDHPDLKRKGGDTMNQPRYDDAHLGGLEQRINIIGVGGDDFENKIEELNQKHNVELTPDDDEFLDYI